MAEKEAERDGGLEEEEEEEEEKGKPKQMQGLRGYWSSSRGESTVGGSLLSLCVTDQ